MRKDTTDDTDEDESGLIIKTREQKMSMAQKRKMVSISTDFNNLAKKCMKIKQEGFRNVSSNVSGTHEHPSQNETFQQDFGDQFLNIDKDVENEEIKENNDLVDDSIYQYANNDQEAGVSNADNTQEQNQTTAFGNIKEQPIVDQKSTPFNVITFPANEENQIITMSCQNCVNVLRAQEESRKTQLVHDNILMEIRSVVSSFKHDILRELRSIKEDTSATLASVDPNETPELGGIPGFTLPLDSPEDLRAFEDKLGLDSTFRSLVVNIIMLENLSLHFSQFQIQNVLYSSKNF